MHAINAKETAAVERGLKKAKWLWEERKKRFIGLKTDNTSAIFNIRKGKAVKRLVGVTRSVFRRQKKLGLRVVQVEHLKGIENVTADMLSRMSLHWEFAMRSDVLGAVLKERRIEIDVDAFATRTNRKCERYWSKEWEEEAEAGPSGEEVGDRWGTMHIGVSELEGAVVGDGTETTRVVVQSGRDVRGDDGAAGEHLVVPATSGEVRVSFIDASQWRKHESVEKLVDGGVSRKLTTSDSPEPSSAEIRALVKTDRTVLLSKNVEDEGGSDTSPFMALRTHYEFSKRWSETNSSIQKVDQSAVWLSFATGRKLSQRQVATEV
ncbi:hypothetical protein BLNAU_14175 [Blattamonas nauphoetae]|uniref:RNase H type-1 domain-containing protein n=1 Tax=Blattamonas nauphoetae TaxID=2049346 RepID=A0ABQ9XEH7_9EUKA|nr:hypothetical protein BLNAU_14175 [Blattamonas nauphoetae]